jgi:dTDP-4-dehydrorhamnose reductase
VTEGAELTARTMMNSNFMKLLIIGSNGQLGWELGRQGQEQGFDILPLDLPEFDLTDSAELKRVVSQTGASLVINASAYTAVDEAESEPDTAFAVNRDGPAHLAALCHERGIPLIHVSTDYVFDGTKKGFYKETDPVSPMGVYGRSKAEGERAVRERLDEHLIIRTAWLYGIHGNNFVKTMLRLGRERETVQVVADQYGCPTYAADLAEAILGIASRIAEKRTIAWGTYHYCGRGVTTWHGFAEAVFDEAKRYDSFRVKTVAPITTQEYPTPAKRPANSALDCSLIEERFGVRTRPWHEGLVRMIPLLLSHEGSR